MVGGTGSTRLEQDIVMRHLRTTTWLIATLLLANTLGSAAAAVPPPTPIIGTFQKQRADDRLKSLPMPEKVRFQTLLTRARSKEEQQYLIKALAVGHPVKSVEDFATTIRGKDRAWLRDHLTVTNNSKGKGIQQLWNDACGPVTALAAKGELDPIWSLRYQKCDQKKFQKLLLERPYSNGTTGGVAVARGNNGGGGRWIEDFLTLEKKKTGITYSLRHLQGGYGLSNAMADLDSALAAGVPVPIVAKSASVSHYALALSVRTANGQKIYTIHDPWSGQTVERTETDFRRSRLDLAGNDQLSSLSMPKW
jgi:hypothetical protein